MMGISWVCIIYSILLLLLAQANGELANVDDFYPTNINHAIDSFVYKDHEYIFVDFDFKPHTANLYCSVAFKAQLVRIETEDLALFLADALSETDHYLDNVWTSGRKRGDNWVWGTNNEEINKGLLERYYMSRENEEEYNTTRECLGFRRNSHDEPKLLSLSCRLPRPPICERKKGLGETDESGSSHPGWIKIRERYYKIYQDRVAYENASKNCIKHDINARLAVLETTDDAEKLARYMAIGRPKLENAWIGARWSNEKELYEFEEEDIQLADKTDPETRYPPWRDGEIQKKKGCVFFDRHGHQGNVSFVEGRCARFRPYICYKKADDISDTVIVEDNIRVFYHPRPWEEAKEFCESFTKPGRLPEPKTETEMKKLIYIMGENYAAIGQLWLGGLYYGQGDWKWVTNKTSIPINEDYPVWLSNDTYTVDVEENNRCLNLDRENHNVGIFYGTDCSFPQRFICVFEGGIPPDALLPEGQITPGNIGGTSKPETEAPTTPETKPTTETPPNSTIDSTTEHTTLDVEWP